MQCLLLIICVPRLARTLTWLMPLPNPHKNQTDGDMHYITDFSYSRNDKKGILKARFKQVIQIISVCTE
jgi:hypothetical protein